MTAKHQPPGPAASPSEALRLVAVSLDALFALVSGIVVGTASAVAQAGHDVAQLQPASAAFWGVALGTALAVSFANHVVLTTVTRASLGKAVAGLRVVRSSDGGRARFIRLLGRWLFGYYWLIVFVPLHLATDSDVEQQDAVGLCTVRRTVRA
ncbi:RDD family protein [Streptomyces coelicoflavus]|uniref:RDD family protein n=1 Tax=Streptomyces coelicoflavus TaxID=285562 RepID=A0A7K3PEM4_9ACTN|nr:RDD family protein [Streptomyces coelicoflavus]NEB07305.1 RDD family protein [Streptomyces coelicoflavus]